jgi:Mad3/BUB1 homology region 2
VNLEAIYVDSEEFSFEELLAKKRGIYGLRFEVEKPKSPVGNTFRSETIFAPKVENPRSPVEHVLEPKVKRSPLQTKPIAKTPTPSPTAEKLDRKDDDVVYMPIRGTKLFLSELIRR